MKLADENESKPNDRPQTFEIYNIGKPLSLPVCYACSLSMLYIYHIVYYIVYRMRNRGKCAQKKSRWCFCMFRGFVIRYLIRFKFELNWPEDIFFEILSVYRRINRCTILDLCHFSFPFSTLSLIFLIYLIHVSDRWNQTVLWTAKKNGEQRDFDRSESVEKSDRCWITREQPHMPKFDSININVQCVRNVPAELIRFAWYIIQF